MIWRIIWTEEYRANPDFTTYLGKIGIVSGFELWLGIIVACIPTLAPLFRVGRFSQGTTTHRSFGNSSNRTTGDGYSIITGSGSQQGFVLKTRGGLHEEFLPAGTDSHVRAECAFDTHSSRQGSPMKPDVIYVRTNVEV